MKLTPEESRALGFIAFLLILSAGARLYSKDEPVDYGTDHVHIPALAAASAARLEAGADGGGKRRASKKAGARAGKTSPRTGQLDPNTATAQELDELPGIGKATAERIVRARGRGVTLRTVDDLARIPGIGRARARNLARHMTLDSASREEQTGRGKAHAGSRTTPASPRLPNPASSRTPDPGGLAERSIDPNAATAEELDRLPGIGPALAARILADRARNGRFRTPEDLARVPGIGPANLSRIRPYIRLAP